MKSFLNLHYNFGNEKSYQLHSKLYLTPDVSESGIKYLDTLNCLKLIIF